MQNPVLSAIWSQIFSFPLCFNSNNFSVTGRCMPSPKKYWQYSGFRLNVLQLGDKIFFLIFFTFHPRSLIT